MRGRLTSWLVAGTLGLASSGGCHASLVRLEARGEHQKVVESVTSSRVEPRHARARAYARSLEAIGRPNQARAVLLRDFRRGGDLKSLAALADLELRLGLDGIAAAHYARALSQSELALKEHPQACDLFRRRARALAASGQAYAADMDLGRVALTCKAGQLSDADVDADRRFAASVREASMVEVRATRTLPGREGPERAKDRAAREQVLAEASREAAGRGARDLVRWADDEGVSLPLVQLFELLAAEREGELGPGWLGNTRVRRYLGERPTDEVEEAAQGLPPELRTYVIGRVRAARDLAPQKAPAGSLNPRGESWRDAVVSGEASRARLALENALRPSEPAAAPEPSEPGEGAPASDSPWWTTLELDPARAQRLWALAALVEKAAPDQALGMRIRVAGEAAAQPMEGAIAEQVRLELARARPLSALALAEAVPGDFAERAQPAIAASARLLDHACADGCGGARDPAVGLLGAEWAEWARVRLHEAAARRAHAPPGDGACPSLAELLAPGSASALAEGLQLARDDLASSRVAIALLDAVERDLSAACSKAALDLLGAGQHHISIETLRERMTHGADIPGAAAMSLRGALELAAERQEAARMRYEQAAALSVDPVSTWRAAAVDARRAGAWGLERAAWQQVILHGGDRHEASVALAASRLLDAGKDGMLEEREVALDAYQRVVIDAVGRLPSQRRYAFRHDLARELARRVEGHETLSVIESALWSDPTLRAAHPVTRGLLRRAAGADRAPTVAVLDLVDHIEVLRVTLADETISIAERRRAAVGLASVGDPGDRGRAIGFLLRHTRDPERRRRLEDDLLSSPEMLEQVDEELVAAPMIADDAISFALLWDLQVPPVQ